MQYKYTHSQAGFAHLAIVIGLFLVIAGTLGFVAYNAMHKNQASAQSWLSFGGTPRNTTSYSSSDRSTAKSDIPELPAPVTVTFTPDEWSLSKYAQVVDDPKYGKVLQINKVGLEADKLDLATLPATNKKFKILSDFNNIAVANKPEFYAKYRKNHYVAEYCASTQQLYSNQKWSAYPYVSTFQTHIEGLGLASGYALSGMHPDLSANGTATYKWYENECHYGHGMSGTYSFTDRLNGKVPKGLEDTQYGNGLRITTKTELSPSKNSAANGTIKIGNVSITYTWDYTHDLDD